MKQMDYIEKIDYIRRFINNLMKIYGVKGAYILRSVLALTAVRDGLSLMEICSILNYTGDKVYFIMGIMNDLKIMYDEYLKDEIRRYRFREEIYRDFILSEFPDDVAEVKKWLEDTDDT
jgi:hypothetical protein